MMILYYFGLAFVFGIQQVQIIMYMVGIILLSHMAIKNIRNAKKVLDITNKKKQSLWKSAMDGAGSALFPSSLIWWVSTVGTVLVSRTDNIPHYLLACIGILSGFMLCNVVYFVIVALVDKFSSNKIIYWLNILSGCILFYIAYTFVLELMAIL